MKNIVLASTLAAILSVVPGCLLLAGAAVGAGVVYAAGDDTAEVRVDVSAEEAYTAAREELAARGDVTLFDHAARKLEARVGRASVTVTVVADSEMGHAKVCVKARKNGGVGPDMDTAHDVAVAVVRRTG